MIGIVVALYSEAVNLINQIDNKTEILIADKKAYKGTLSNKDIIIAISGIGKVSAALTTQLLIDTFNTSCIVNFGTAGGMNASVQILNYYIIEKACQFDFDLRELDNVPLGYIQEYNTAYFTLETKNINFLNKSNLASADRFTNDITDINSINELGCSLRDMEGGAIAQVCTSNRVPLYMIKGVTDVYGNRTAQEQFYENLKQVSAGFPDVLKNLLTLI